MLLKPKLLTTLSDYSQEQFVKDFFAGIIVGIVAIPLAIAFGIASGVTPEKGLLTAVIGGFFVSALGGSRVQIGGPTGAFVVIVYGIVEKYGIDGLTIATILAGGMLIGMGLARLGVAIKFIPHPVVVGFTSGIAVIIFSSEGKDFLGLKVGSLPAEFIPKWQLIFSNLGSVNPWAILIAGGTLILMAFWPRVSRTVPGSMVAIVLFSVLVKVLGWPVETIGSRFGEFKGIFSAPHLPSISFELVRRLMPAAFTVAMLGGIESLLSAVVSDGMIGGRHRSNMELIAQGTANIASGLCGGIPATGAIARTVTNIKNGGRTPVAGIVHALAVLVCVLFLGHWVKLIPLACLAGILVMVSYHMSEWRSFVSLLKGPRSDMLVLVATFLLTVLIDLTIAIEIGVVLSAFLFMRRMAKATEIKIISDEVEDEAFEGEVGKLSVPQGVEVFEINGPFFFGVSHEFEETMRIVSKKPKVWILRLRNVPVMDATGLYSLEQFYRRCRHDGVSLILAGLNPQPQHMFKHSKLSHMIDSKNSVKDIGQALKRAQEILKSRV